ncbi:hypothetical protein OEZ86_008495 [Tetradesmus obliquus]|nr:hypothetical protein OEZ86_008495 [Tetradesmus obliquus]
MLSTALASSSNTLAELALDSCKVSSNHSAEAGAAPKNLTTMTRATGTTGTSAAAAAAAAAIAGGQLTHLCLEGEGLDARDLALTVRQLYHKRPDALPQLRELELKTCTRMPGVAGANDADETSVAACGVQRGGCGLRASGCDGMRLVAEGGSAMQQLLEDVAAMEGHISDVHDT